jgi:hypothetical protein
MLKSVSEAFRIRYLVEPEEFTDVSFYSHAATEQAVTLEPAEVVTRGRRTDASNGESESAGAGLRWPPFTQGSRRGEQDFFFLAAL